VPLTMYTTTWCGFCKNLKRQLAKAGIELAEVDIELDPEAAKFVESVNGGNQTVPTLLFADGSTMVNPSAKEVQARLAELSDAVDSGRRHALARYAARALLTLGRPLFDGNDRSDEGRVPGEIAVPRGSNPGVEIYERERASGRVSRPGRRRGGTQGRARLDSR
jgi:mycoredoxin